METASHEQRIDDLSYSFPIYRRCNPPSSVRHIDKPTFDKSHDRRPSLSKPYLSPPPPSFRRIEFSVHP